MTYDEEFEVIKARFDNGSRTGATFRRFFADLAELKGRMLAELFPKRAPAVALPLKAKARVDAGFRARWRDLRRSVLSAAINHDR